MVVALLCSIALSVLVIIGNKSYFSGRHVWDIPISTFEPHRLNVWVSMWCYIIAATLVKVSVLLFYRRLSVKFSRLFLIATWIGIAYNVLYLVGFALVLLLLCNPADAYWKSFDPHWTESHNYKCIPEGQTTPVSAALSVIGDFYSTLLPVLLIFNLNLPRRQKFALYGLFALGFLAVAAGIVRTVLLYILLNVDYDFSWMLWESWIWAVVELYVAIFAASAPALKPFFRRFFIESMERVARSSRRLGDATMSSGRREQKEGALVSSTAKELDDIERIGMAYSGRDNDFQDDEFLRDIEHEETRHFQLRASRDGKIIPVQVYEGEQDGSSSLTATPRADDWPMPPLGNPADGPARQHADSQASEQTIQVGLQIEQLAQRAASGRGSVASARVRAQAQLNRAYERGFGLNPRLFEDMHDGLGAGSRLESPSDTDQAETDEDEKAPWNTIETTSGPATQERSHSKKSLHLPRMGSRDFDLERTNASRPAMRVGHAI